MHHNKKQEKESKTMGIICLVNAHCWEIFAYMYYLQFSNDFYLKTSTVNAAQTSSNTRNNIAKRRRALAKRRQN